ncbi:hypothetical protein M422DRAFT_261683 [Sphaerobolus stellatus SS14]|uniref:Unplaced genomic scaffold SPHSTscaffold_108, whole genome shotgun sequence n=1 Tax=Sphaerobolus stellatus (strain SS14) TaxID=990650 RepID=A0A0C9VEU9_SPHS4|nr:hypothetical protein M422DRAFT_261683 [Sphaerobolus stellatus SS14]
MSGRVTCASAKSTSTNRPIPAKQVKPCVRGSRKKPTNNSQESEPSQSINEAPETSLDAVLSPNQSASAANNSQELQVSTKNVLGIETRALAFPYSQDPILSQADILSITEKHKSPSDGDLASKRRKGLPATSNELLQFFTQHEQHIQGLSMPAGSLADLTPSPALSISPMPHQPSINQALSNSPSDSAAVTPLAAVTIMQSAIDPQLLNTPSIIPSTTTSTSTTQSTVSTVSQPVTTGSVASSHVVEREPGFIGASKKKLGDTSPRTKALLDEAVLNYKCRVVSDHPSPESKGCKVQWGLDAWKKAHLTHPPVDSPITFMKEIGDIIHNLGITFRQQKGMKLIEDAAKQYNIKRPLTKYSKNKVEGLLEDGTFTFAVVLFDYDGKVSSRKLTNAR